MNNRLKSDQATKIGMHETQHRASFEFSLGAVPILDESEVVDITYLLEKIEFDALSSWTYFEPLQFR